MAAYFLDTSALVKRYVREIGSDWVRNLTRPRSPDAIYIARITVVEITSAVTRRQLGHSLTTRQAGSLLGHFHRHLSGRFRVLELNPPIFDEAIRLARVHGLRAYDAVQLASALNLQRLRLEAGLEPATLVSADRELNAAGFLEGTVYLDPNTFA
jgi:predicted nucleic acid-binding protein